MAGDHTNDAIPFASLETLFLDVGNTLVSMDYDWIAEELRGRGIPLEIEQLKRAEARARPVVSRSLRDKRSSTTEGKSTFAVYLGAILENLGVPVPEPAALIEELVPVFKAPGAKKLWSYVIPGVPEALAQLRSTGLELVVVSNSDGSVESVLEGMGLTKHLSAVFDSHVVGFEKPDPRLFLHALEQTGATAETTLHVGDIYEADIVGGRRAGIHVALIDPYDDWPNVDCPRFTALGDLAKQIA